MLLRDLADYLKEVNEQAEAAKAAAQATVDRCDEVLKYAGQFVLEEITSDEEVADLVSGIKSDMGRFFGDRFGGYAISDASEAEQEVRNLVSRLKDVKSNLDALEADAY